MATSELAFIKETNFSGLPIQLFVPDHSPVKQIKCKGNQTYVILEDGTFLGYFKPDLYDDEEQLIAEQQESSENQNDSTRVISPEISLGNHIQVSFVSCSIHFCLVLSRAGLVYSMGSLNNEGELGHGDSIARASPTLIESLAEQKIISIACGFKHSLACNYKGEVFSWGWGGFGQLGLGEKKNELFPRKINMEELQKSRHKVIQVQATFKSSLAMTDNHKILWWGTNSTLRLRTKPCELDLGTKVINKSFFK